MVPALVALALAVGSDAGVPRSLEPPEKELRTATEAATKDAKRWSSMGQYDTAAQALQTVVDRFKPRLEQYSDDELRKAGLFSPLKREGELADLYRRRARWQAAASTDKGAARDLLLSLVAERHYDADNATLADTRAQDLLASLRKLDPQARALFAPRKLKVVVDSPLPDTLKRTYAENLVTALRLLGLEASTDTGDEVFEVTATEGKVISMGNEPGSAFPPNTISCELVAKAKWTAKGKPEMAALDLGKRGGGFSDIPDSCIKQRLTESAAIAPLAIFKAWAAR